MFYRQVKNTNSMIDIDCKGFIANYLKHLQCWGFRWLYIRYFIVIFYTFLAIIYACLDWFTNLKIGQGKNRYVSSAGKRPFSNSVPFAVIFLTLIFRRPKQSQGLLNKHLCHLISHSLPLTALRRRHAQTVWDTSLSYKTHYVIVMKSFLNLEAHQNRIGFKSYSHFTERVDFAHYWSCIGKGLRLQPAWRLKKIYWRKIINYQHMVC